MPETKQLHFIDNPALGGRREAYADVTVDALRVLESWKRSLYAFEWLGPDGRIRACADLPDTERARRMAVEERLAGGQALEKPVLGIGLLDTVEIGAGRAVFLTLTAAGHRAIPVHVPRSVLDEFAPFLAAPPPQDQSARGGIFYYILIAVALFAALGFAVAQGWRASGAKLSEDRQRLLATDIIAYGDMLARTTSHLRLRGTALTELSFADAALPAADYGTPGTDSPNEIFNPTGGAAVYQAPPAAATVNGGESYRFLAANAVQDVGTTCAAASCADLLAVLTGVRANICTRINDLAGVVNPGGAPPVDTAIDTAAAFKPAAAPFSYAATLGDEDAALAGKHEGCFEETGAGRYVYYRVLIPR